MSTLTLDRGLLAKGDWSMKWKLFLWSAFILSLLKEVAIAWNLEAMQINALKFKKDGTIQFTLFEPGSSNEFLCSAGPVDSPGSGSQWFMIPACQRQIRGEKAGRTFVFPEDFDKCSASVERMASMLLAAKLAGRPVHVQRNGCRVSEVAMKP